MRDTLNAVMCLLGLGAAVMLVYAVVLYLDGSGMGGSTYTDQSKVELAMVWAVRGVSLGITTVLFAAMIQVYGFLEDCSTAAKRWLSDRRREDLERKP